jgi:hypothetical protein
MHVCAPGRRFSRPEEFLHFVAFFSRKKVEQALSGKKRAQERPLHPVEGALRGVFGCGFKTVVCQTFAIQFFHRSKRMRGRSRGSFHLLDPRRKKPGGKLSQGFDFLPS